MSATQAVFNLPESVEEILLQRDDWNAPFALMRVSKTFRTVIERSMHLQHKMWLTDQDPRPLSTLPPPVGINPFIYSAEFSRHLRFPCKARRKLEWRVVKIWMSIVADGARVRLVAELLPIEEESAFHTSIDTGAASWRRLLCSQRSGMWLAVIPQDFLANPQSHGYRRLCGANLQDLLDYVQGKLDEVSVKPETQFWRCHVQ